MVIGGDFNTLSADREPLYAPVSQRALLDEDPGRLLHPIPYEPLFEVATRFGYQWQSANLAGSTKRAPPHDNPALAHMHID